MDETYIKVQGPCKYLYRAVDSDGDTVDSVSSPPGQGLPRSINLRKRSTGTVHRGTVSADRSGSNRAALQAINAERATPIGIRQRKYPNKIVEQDHRAIKRITKPMLGFREFRCACVILYGISRSYI